ncbi:hypothetical protein NDU88_001080 [Pleurodeles waltl]|uniref:Uncharacterized protein n=1 Tax=Pleurodeles waltl TaxID=8319 RepID=A0AAV7U5X3_PLEWA|nr:hypothetical protein NDU88_001080 [Pleurodeles waltl]
MPRLCCEALQRPDSNDQCPSGPLLAQSRRGPRCPAEPSTLPTPRKPGGFQPPRTNSSRLQSGLSGRREALTGPWRPRPRVAASPLWSLPLAPYLHCLTAAADSSSAAALLRAAAGLGDRPPLTRPLYPAAASGCRARRSRAQPGPKSHSAWQLVCLLRAVPGSSQRPSTLGDALTGGGSGPLCSC